MIAFCNQHIFAIQRSTSPKRSTHDVHLVDDDVPRRQEGGGVAAVHQRLFIGGSASRQFSVDPAASRQVSADPEMKEMEIETAGTGVYARRQ